MPAAYRPVPPAIFCNNNHLVLSQPRCDVPGCGWVRPPLGQTGQIAWRKQLDAPIAGSGRSSTTRPAAAEGVAVFPLDTGELVGLSLESGELRWRSALPEGNFIRALDAYGSRLVGCANDERSVDRAESARLLWVDPASGKYATLWQPPNGCHLLIHQPHAGGLIVRTAQNQLLRLDEPDFNRPVWTTALTGWCSLPLVRQDQTILLYDGRSIMGENHLSAFEFTSGQLLWESPMSGSPTSAPACEAGRLYTREGKRGIVARSLADGRVLWRLENNHIYSNLATCGEILFLAVRGVEAETDPNHYQLAALRSADGKELWRAPLPARIRQIIRINAHTLLLASDRGNLLTVGAADGKVLWSLALTTEEDLLRTELSLSQGMVLAGLYSGWIAGVRVLPEPEQPVAPEEYLAHNEPDSAARAFALRGNLRRAAELYAQLLRQPRPAFILYQAAGDFSQAGALALENGWLSEALACFERAGDLAGQIQILLKTGDELRAAPLLEQANRLPEAAGYYERFGQLERARRIYEQLNRPEDVWRIDQKMAEGTAAIEDWLRKGQPHRAAQIAWQRGYVERALKIYQEAGLEDQEIAALRQVCIRQPEPWMVMRLAELARKHALFEEEARALESLAEYEKAAAAYQRAARKLEVDQPAAETQIARLYEQAMTCYEKSFKTERREECLQQVRRFRRLPVIYIQGETSRSFREKEWNRIPMEIRNEGFGIAQNIRLKVARTHFDVDADASTLEWKFLENGRRQEFDLSLRPHAGEAGEHVPLVLEWDWQDRTGQQFKEKANIGVHVRPADLTPQINWRGDYHHVEGDQFSGDKIGRDKVSGDKLETGAQKGDRVELHRDSGVRIVPDRKGTGALKSPDAPEELHSRTCPNCHLPVEMHLKFCSECGHALEAA